MKAVAIDAGPAKLRTWKLDDLDDLVAAADSRAIWRNLTESFPNPYTRSDGQTWIAHCLEQEPPRDLVVAVDDRVAGVCGFAPQRGVACGGVIGYWLGEDHWGKGIATAALRAFLGYVWETFSVDRLEARVFAWNPASARVLAKNGFVLEGRRRNAICKDGQVTDELIYGLLRSEDP